MFRVPIQKFHDDVMDEFPRDKVIALNCDLTEETLPSILCDLTILHDEFGWRVIAHETLRDTKLVHDLCFNEFLSELDHATQNIKVHLELRGADDKITPYDLFDSEHTIDCTLDDMEDAELALKSLINHGRYFAPESPKNKPITRQMLRIPV